MFRVERVAPEEKQSANHCSSLDVTPKKPLESKGTYKSVPRHYSAHLAWGCRSKRFGCLTIQVDATGSHKDRYFQSSDPIFTAK